jgi:WD40 repeat protein
VLNVAYSPKGNLLASASSDNTVTLWDPSRQTPQQVLSDSPEGASSVAFSPDGHILAAAGDQDTRIRLWDVSSRAEMAPLTGHSGGTRTLAFSSDGGTLAAGTADGTITLWDLAARRSRVLSRLSGVRQVAFSPKGGILAAASDHDPAIRLWRFPSRTPLPALRGGHYDGVQAIAFSNDGRTLASAGIQVDSRIHVWELDRQQSYELTNDVFTSALAFNRDGTLASSADYRRLVWLWDVKRRVRVRALTGHTDTVTTLAFSPDGHTLASGSQDRTIALFDLTVPALTGHTDFVRNIAFSRDGKLLASAGDDNRVFVWDVARRIPLRVLRGVTGVAFSPDGRLVASTDGDKKVLLWDLDRSSPPREPPWHPPGVFRLAFSPTARLLALPGDDGRIVLWDPDHGTSRTLSGHHGAVETVAFSPDGSTLASAGADKVILWDVATGASLPPLNGQTGGMSSLAFSPDGSTLAMADGSVTLWDVARRNPVATLGEGISVAFSPDGGSLAVGTAAEPPDYNSTVVLYDVARRTPLITLERGIGATFSPDGRTLATAGQDIVFRDMDAASWPARLCHMVGRDLTKAEWNDQIPGRRYQTVCH